MNVSIRWLREAPEGTTVPVSAVLPLLDALEAEPEPAPEPQLVVPTSWPDLLWIVPAERRMTTKDVALALCRSRSWLYTHLSGENAIPHAKLDGELVFKAGEVRAWLRDSEDVVRAGRMAS